MIATPFYELVPKDLATNLAFRERMLKDSAESKQRQHELWIMCKRDPLFFINTFAWTYDPRLKHTKAVPFITYKFQDRAILEVIDGIGDHDVVVEKSRDMGASWMILAAFDWKFLFYDRCSFLLLSRKEDLVDKAENPDALMWKLDFIHNALPGWLQPNLERTRLMMMNHTTNSTIAGDSTTGDAGRGGRYTAAMVDEFASIEEGEKVLSATGDATTCRIFNSTPKGQGNAFFKVRTLAKEGTSTSKLLSLHWKLHPVKARGLYFDVKDNLKPRSPWYDNECKRRHPMEIAQELDIDYLGSDYQFFEAAVLDRIEKEHCRRPYLRGDIDFDPETLEVRKFVKNESGPLQLWTYLDAQDNPSSFLDPVLGVDIATGTGSSNSVISGASKRTGEKFLEYANPRISPEALGKYSVALAKWLKALLIWEANGPGRIYGNTVVETGYRKLFWRQKENSISKKISDTPGWYSTKDSKLELLGRYRSALSTGEYINRSKSSVEEARHYIFMSNGIVAHSSTAATDDPTGASDNHGDRVIADALTCRALKEVHVAAATEHDVPKHCFAARKTAYEEQHKRKASW